MTTFILGTHEVSWLATAGVPLMVSCNRLRGRKTFPRAITDWFADSGGFTELKMHGGWRFTAEEHAADLRRFRGAIGMLTWASPQDWMCEPWVITGKNTDLPPSHPMYFHGTREARGIPDGEPDEDLTAAIRKHQRWTVDNFLELRAIAPDLPIIPVLQGWELNDYLHCAEMYEAAGVDLINEPVIGLGSVCRRQASWEIDLIVSTLTARGYNLHGYGVKIDGLGAYGYLLESSDSMSWSIAARYEGAPLPGCTHKTCSNCLRYALAWYRRNLEALASPVQLSLPLGA